MTTQFNIPLKGSMSKANINVVGPKGMGKRTFINRILTGEFVKEPDTLPTKFTMILQTNYGKFTLVCSVSEEAEKKADAYLIFCSRLVPNSCQKGFALADGIKNVPKVLCGNKCDMYRKDIDLFSVNVLATELGKRKGLKWYDVSCKSNYNFEKPFLYLLRQLTGNQNLVCTKYEPVTPPEVSH